MKYIIVLGDGMADYPIPELDGKTPLEYASTPNMDRLAASGQIGLVQTIPEGMKPGSDTANLAVLGYNPREYYTGRSPLEALSIGVPMTETDIALRCNLVTLSEEEPYQEKKILDHSASEIPTEEAQVLIEAVKEAFEKEEWRFYTGTSYRHLLLWHGGHVIELTPPHDILEQQIGSYLPEESMLRFMMEQSFQILNHHPLNEARAAKGLHKANSLWFWGAGTRPKLTSFIEKTGKKGAMISAVDLLKGIAAGSGMRIIEVEGANGTLHTNYEGKAMAAADALLKQGEDFVYVHVEAPDEMGHQGSVERKVQAIEYLDARVLHPLLQRLEESGTDFRMLILPDHPTPVAVRTHTSDAVPYLLYDSKLSCSKNKDQKRVDSRPKSGYNEAEAQKTGRLLREGYQLIDVLLEMEFI